MPAEKQLLPAHDSVLESANFLGQGFDVHVPKLMDLDAPSAVDLHEISRLTCCTRPFVGLYEFETESRNRPKQVNATITASIQYWERAAFR